MPTQPTAGEGVPSVFYRNAIDLNRFSNGIARKLAQENVNVIVRAVDQLKKIDESKGPSYKAARLRSLIKQTKKTLSTWQEKSVDVMIKDLESVAKVQAGFVEDQLKKALPAGMQKQIVEEIGYSVQSVAVSPGFAKAVVTNTPTKFNLGQAGKFNLTAKQGAEVLLPNGETISKAFRGLAAKQANQFNQIVRTGLLSGEPTPDIVRQLVGNLDFGEKAKTIKQLNMAGGEVTKLATHQINTIVRTSVNQVSNAASQSVYKANKKITKEYRYISTLDSRTSTVCRNLDGQIFAYGKGPEPPQHFGCRSTTVPVIDYKGNGWPAPPSVTTAKRASADGPVPANTTYGKWLYDQRAKTKSGNLSKFTPGPEQIKALGKEKAKYFNRLADKYGADQAMAKFMREDGSEVTLKKLESRYGKPEDIKPKAKKTKLLSDKEKKSLAAFEKIKPPSKALIAKEGNYMTAAEKAGLVPYKPLTAAQKKLIDNSTAEVLAQEKEYGLLAKKAASIKNKDEYVQQSRKNEAKIRKLKSDFKKTTTKTISDNDHSYVGEVYVPGKTPEQDKFVKLGTERIKEMGYKIDNKMLDGRKKKGWSSEFERLEEYIASWKGGSASTQMAQSWQLEQSGADLSTFAKYKATSFKKMKAASRKIFVDQANALEDFVKRSPSYDGQIHRGMTIRKDRFNEFLTDLATGKPTATLESWSSEVDIADDFAEIKRIKGAIGARQGFQSDRVHVMLTVKKNKYGSSITNLANDYQHEMEVLIPSKIRYSITDIEQTPIGDTGEMFWNVILEQI